MDKFQFQSVPQPVYANTKTSTRPLYRQTQAPLPTDKPQNIHYDRRVVRGNTYAAAITTLNQLQAQAASAAATRALSHSSRRPRRTMRNTAAEDNNLSAAVQTDDYLELLEANVEGRDAGMQTDELDDERPLPVMYVAAAPGIDQSTQIEAGELFDFELGVVPVVESLLGRQFQTALHEVREEEELKDTHARVAAFEQERDLMTAEAHRLEEGNLRKHEEAARRVAQEAERLAEEARVKEQLLAQRTAQEYLEGLQDEVLAVLEAGGALADPVRRDVDTVFLPWLEERVGAEVAKLEQARACMDDLIGDAVKIVYDERAEIARKLAEERERVAAQERAAAAAKREALRLEEEERQRVIEEAEMMEREEEARLLAAALAGNEGDEGDFLHADMDEDESYMEDDDQK